MHKSDESENTRGWNTYWTGARDAEALTSGGISHPIFPQFWDKALSPFLADGMQPRILDIATGSGAVIDRLHQQPDANLGSVTCVDIAEAAIGSVRSRFPGVTGIVADAKSLPLESGAYDLITSQFGIEYAGAAAIDEAVRLTAAGGTLLFLMHIRPGTIFNECTAAVDAIGRTQRCEFIPRALAMFEAGFAAVRGADRAAYDEAGKRLAPAIREVESVITDHGEQVAGGTVAKLYADVGQIHSRMQHYDPDEILGWLRTMERELDDYRQRMASMREAAIDERAFSEIGENLREAGFEVIGAGPLVAQEGDPPMAWVLSATRRGNRVPGLRTA